MTTSVRCWGERCRKTDCQSPRHPKSKKACGCTVDMLASDDPHSLVNTLPPEEYVSEDEGSSLDRYRYRDNAASPKVNGTLEVPSPESSFNELREHFKIANARLACLPHEDAIHACLTCLRQGENTCGKPGNPAGRNRFCSTECEAVFEALERKRPKLAVMEVVTK